MAPLHPTILPTSMPRNKNMHTYLNCSALCCLILLP